MGYNFIKLLRFCVDTFGFLNTEERIKAIQNIWIPQMLKNLEYYIKLTGFIQYLILEYSTLIKPF